MKRIVWRKHHKWTGLLIALFLLSFCVSGLLLNHRSLIKNVNVSRSILPSRYEFKKWNGGLLRGTMAWNGRVLLYGNGGIWLTDSAASSFEDFNRGLPVGADYRQIRSVVNVENSHLFAVSPFSLYRYGMHESWHCVDVPLTEGEKLSDITAIGDTLVVLGRSYAYLSHPPYKTFRRISLPPAPNYDGKATAFRTVWLLHSGELFGTAGKLMVDAIALILVVLSISGILFWLMTKRRFKPSAVVLRSVLNLHDKVGRYTIAFTLFIAITGWCLRPPVMIALVLNKLPVLPGTVLCGKNPWNDKLRMIRYDESQGDWLLSTSEGFYSLSPNVFSEGNSVKNSIVKIETQPPVSVMGLNALEKSKDGKWLCGSFSGLFVWNRTNNQIIDYFTGQPAPKTSGAPFGKKAISGISMNFASKEGGKLVVAEYDNGTDFVPQPVEMNTLPMSLWNVALEFHSGRIFIGNIATYIFIFITGCVAIWCLVSGFKIRMRRRNS